MKGTKPRLKKAPLCRRRWLSESEEESRDQADHDSIVVETGTGSSDGGDAEEEEADAVQVESGDHAEGDAELEDLAYELLSQMLQKLDIEAEIELSWLDDQEDGESPLNLNVVGGDLGILIGRNGETLASIQYLIPPNGQSGVTSLEEHCY